MSTNPTRRMYAAVQPFTLPVGPKTEFGDRKGVRSTKEYHPRDIVDPTLFDDDTLAHLISQKLVRVYDVPLPTEGTQA